MHPEQNTNDILSDFLKKGDPAVTGFNPLLWDERKQRAAKCGDERCILVTHGYCLICFLICGSRSSSSWPPLL